MMKLSGYWKATFQNPGAVDSLSLFSRFANRVVSDERLKPIHLSILFVMCDAWLGNQLTTTIYISRSILMKASRVRSKATYHKVIRDLSSFGYIRYMPSYHPKRGSAIIMLMQ
jgi:hypothetical protein